MKKITDSDLIDFIEETVKNGNQFTISYSDGKFEIFSEPCQFVSCKTLRKTIKEAGSYGINDDDDDNFDDD